MRVDARLPTLVFSGMVSQSNGGSESARNASDGAGAGGQTSGSSVKRLHTPKSHAVCDKLSSALIYSMLVLCPWLFGSTEAWSMFLMNCGAGALWILLCWKWLVRLKTGFRPARWDDQEGPGGRLHSFLSGLMAFLTVVILAFCFVSAWNARATFSDQTLQFTYHDNYIPWLPYSYDAIVTRAYAIRYAALACFFWAFRDWFMTKTKSDRHPVEEEDERGPETFSRSLVPDRRPSGRNKYYKLGSRLRALLWVLSVNGGLLALEGILQRLSGTNDLLWMRRAWWDSPLSSFGPYSYRSNAAEYLNLIWPVSLAFWWITRQNFLLSARSKQARVGQGSHILLLPCTLLMASAPIISSSRGGAFVTVALLAFSLVYFVSHRRVSVSAKLGILVCFVSIVALGGALGWKSLAPRLKGVQAGDLGGRTEIYQNVEELSTQYKLFGTGPGSFASLYYGARKDHSQFWQAFAHNDWLETRMTFGWFGFCVLFAMLVIPWVHWYARRGMPCPDELTVMILFALGGCLAHARFDMPLQIYSILMLVLTLSGILFAVAPARLAGK